MKPSFIFSSNSIRLLWKDWVAVIVILTGALYLFPRAWPALEKFGSLPDYRLPHHLSDNYWLFARWSRYASQRYPVLIMGDSVIWGHYVKKEHALSHYLNEGAGGDIFANMGVDGLHPAAMLGLVKYHGRSISNRGVILHLNLLWMSSKKADLQGEEEIRFNHPRLVPQLFPNLRAYNPSFTEIVGVMAERRLPFFSWINHIRMVYFENMSIQDWSMQNPHKNPLGAITLRVPLPENRPQGRPVSWVEMGMKRQDFPWVEVEESFQWHSFRRVIEILNSRNNKVFVLLGPLNPHILTEESLKRYNIIKDEMERWLEEKGISHYSAPALLSELYADASHPLKEGYAIIAEGLLENQSFQRWLKSKRRR
ncbi:MAG: hypothetical protein DDT40_00794 [candidate division WS2 bacterium]|nr:hypothetical protein [Candidatus Psychracetigena formicireducens]